MSSTGKRREGMVYAVGCVVAIGIAVYVAVRALPGATVSGADPAAAVIGLLALALAVWSGWLSLRALRWQETNVIDMAVRLADAVRKFEETARGQLLAGDRTIDVDFTFQPSPAHNAQFAKPTGHLDQVVRYYQKLHPGRLVITGAPGAGKTVLAIELILGLLENRQADDPVPIRLSAAAWDTAQPIDIWLTRHLVDTYRLSLATADALITARRVLPVIDGLDEMDDTDQPGYTSRAARALEAVNAYQYGRGKADVILTCRSIQYRALEAAKIWVEEAARIEIRPVTAAKAHQFVQRRTHDPQRWTNILDSVSRHAHGALAQGLSTPWRLTLAVTVYDQRDPSDGNYLRTPDELIQPHLNTPDAIRDHLLDHFILAATAPRPPTNDRPYPLEHVQSWLTTLATYLHRNASENRMLGGRPLSGTDIVLHELWPLAGFRRPRDLSVAGIAILWLIALLVFLTHVPIGFSPRQVIGAGAPAIGVIVATYTMWATIWPPPGRTSFRRLLTRKGLRDAATGLMVGFAGGFAIGLAGGVAYALTGASALGFTGGAFALMYALTGGLLGGFTVGLVIGLSESGVAGTPDPGQIVWSDLAGGLAGGFVFGLAGGLGLRLLFSTGLTFTLTAAVATGLTAGLTYGIAQRGGPAGYRYIMLLLSTRRWSAQWLPWRLGSFLNWCYDMGLLRIAGAGYQFRHRELQDHLAQQPHRASDQLHTPDTANLH